MVSQDEALQKENLVTLCTVITAVSVADQKEIASIEEITGSSNAIIQHI